MVLLDLADVASISLAPAQLVHAVLVETVGAGQLKGVIHMERLCADLAFLLNGSDDLLWAVAADQDFLVLGEDCAFWELAFLWTGNSVIG